MTEAGMTAVLDSVPDSTVGEAAATVTIYRAATLVHAAGPRARPRQVGNAPEDPGASCGAAGS